MPTIKMNYGIDFDYISKRPMVGLVKTKPKVKIQKLRSCLKCKILIKSKGRYCGACADEARDEVKRNYDQRQREKKQKVPKSI